jgi:FkbM family methyltransferase
MLIPDLFEKYKLHPSGIIHIGAHMCEERNVYNAAGVEDSNILWIEANPDLVERIRNMDSNIQVIQGVVSNEEKEVSFIVTNNGQSSSFLPLGTHRKHHPYVHESHRLELQTCTLPDLLREHDINVRKYDMLIMDIQGAELHALKGAKDILSYFKYIYLEVNDEEIYEGCGLFTEVAAFLSDHGFELKEKVMTGWRWGDAFFMRK